MLEGKRVAVVVPAHDEEALIGDDDRARSRSSSTGCTSSTTRPTTGRSRAVRALGDPRVEVIGHERNDGVGAAIVTGYGGDRGADRRHRRDGRPTTRWTPATCETLVGPVARGEVDYAKANRLFTGQAWELIPRYRYLGNAMPQPADEDRVGLLARRRLAVGLHGGLAARAGAARPRPDLPALRLPERHARAPERLERARARLPVAADLRRRRALGDPPAQGRAGDLVAAREGLLVAAVGEVRDPRLPPARLLLRARHPDDRRSASALGIAEVVLRIMGNPITPRRSCSSRCC